MSTHDNEMNPGNTATEGGDRSYTAFISYASPDRDKAKEICASLESRGLRCWIAPRDVRPGREYGEEIIAGIRDARSLVLVLSEAANASSMVRREVERAVSSGKPVFPVRIEEVLPARSLEFFVSATHWIDAWDGALVDHARRLADELLDERSLEEASRKSVGKRRKRLYRRASLGTVALLLVAAVSVTFALTRGAGSGPGADEDPVRELAEAQGIDIDKVGADDFSVSVGERFGNLQLVIETSDVLAEMGGRGVVEVRVGSRPWTMAGSDYRSSKLFYFLTPKDLEADGPVELRLAAPGHAGAPTYGPWRYNVRISKAAKSKSADQLEQIKATLADHDWLLNDLTGVWRFSSAFQSEYVEVVEAVELGRAPDMVDVEWVIPRGGGLLEDTLPSTGSTPKVNQLAMASEPITKLTPFMGEKRIYGRLRFVDGTTGERRLFSEADAMLSSLAAGGLAKLRQENSGLRQLMFEFVRTGLGSRADELSVVVEETGGDDRYQIDLVQDSETIERVDQWYVVVNDRARFHKWGPVLPPDWRGVRATLTDGAGEIVATNTFELASVSERWLTFESIEAGGPPLHVSIESVLSSSIALFPECPPRTVDVLIGIGRLPTDSLRFQTNWATVDWNSSWAGDATSEPVNLVFQLADGSEAGPFSYDLSSLADAVRARAKGDATKSRRRLLLAVQRNGPFAEDRGYYDFSRALQAVEGSGDRGWNRPDYKGTLVVPRNDDPEDLGWAAIASYRVGTDPNNLGEPVEVPADAEQIVFGNSRGRRSMDAYTFRAVELPHDVDRVFAQFILFDGTILDPVEVPIERY